MLELAKTMNVGQPKKNKSKKRKPRPNFFTYMFGTEAETARAGAVRRSRVGRVGGDGSDGGSDYFKNSDDSDDYVVDHGRSSVGGRSTGRGGGHRSTGAAGGRRCTTRRSTARGIGRTTTSNARRDAVLDYKDICVTAGNDARRRFDSTRAGNYRSNKTVGGAAKASLGGATKASLGGAPKASLGGTARSSLRGTARSSLRGTARSSLRGTARSSLRGTAKQSVGEEKKTQQDKGFFGYFVNVVESIDSTRGFH